MMKRTGVPRLGPDEPASLTPQQPTQWLDQTTTANLMIQQPGTSTMHTLPQPAQSQILGTSAMLSVGGGFGRGAGRAGAAPPVINYMKPQPVQYAPTKQPPPQVPPRIKQQQQQQQQQPGVVPGGGRQSPGPQAQFQRLKVEDALSYLDQVKYKFNTQPQVYNDFLDIMKEFKSQTIDTPGVITRVSNLFKGHPELIVGFNTFLPPGYKIEVQSNGQVSVSMPSPTGLGSGVLLSTLHHAPQQPQLVHLLPVPQSVSSALVHNLSVSAPGGGVGVNTAPLPTPATGPPGPAAPGPAPSGPICPPGPPGPPGPANTLHHISHAHQQIEAAVHHGPGGGAAGVSASAPAPPGQPVEFNHAIEYVNKIKSRFSRQPDKYKRFLEILHAYQRGHRDLKEPQAKQQTEQEVYSQVAKLFENQEDLLAEFGQFLPDAKAVKAPDRPPTPPMQQQPRADSVELERVAVPPPSPPHHLTPLHHAQITKHTNIIPSIAPTTQHHHLKRSPSFTSSVPPGPVGAAGVSGGAVGAASGVGGAGGAACASGAPPAKKPRCSSGLTGAAVRDVSYADAAKLATHHDYSFFDRARKALRSQHVYDNFLRCLLLFTNEIISSSELLSVTAPFLCRHPDLQKWLQDFVGPPSPPHTPTNTVHTGYSWAGAARYEPVGALGAQHRHERAQPDIAMDIDLSTCKRLGTSYCALPRDAAARRCSGRTPLCKEVLNDTWVSFPSWSEDSTFVTSRKTQYEEYIYRCEDERFELDVVIETNASTIRVLEGVQKKLSRMTPEDAAKYRLDDCLGGHSPTIHQRALRRIYGDKAVDIIAGLKKNPVVAVPVVLRRLKAKEEEWREAQKGFNKQWRELNEKYYLKSLDHQGINFKQNDLKAMRSKSLFNEVESAYAARRPGPHLVLDYNMQSRQEAIKIVRDTAELLIHHARRQTAIQKAEKRRIKQLLRQFLPDLFSHPRQPLSDDERDEDKEEPPSPDSTGTDQVAHENDKSSGNVKQEIKQESSESDNASDKSGKNSKNNKENKPKNNNTDKDSNQSANNVKRSSSSSNEEAASMKSDIKCEPHEMEDDFRDYPPNEARFVCTSSWYLFLRVHGALCQRLSAARRVAAALAADAARQPPTAASALRLKPNNLPADVSSPSEYYNVLLELVKGVLDGNVEPSAYEDAAREMLGIKAYPAYTLDKLVSIAVRQLQHCAAEPWSVHAAELAARGMRGSAAYVRRAAGLLRDRHAAFLVRVYGGDECRVTFELLDGAGEGRTSPHHNEGSRLSPAGQPRQPALPAPTAAVSAVARVAAWSLYAERYARPDASATAPAQQGRSKPVFLARNARARAGGHVGGATSASAPGGTPPPRHARRKPPRLHDAAECTLAPSLRWRAVACRPFALYQPGALAAARNTHQRLAAARRDRFRAWLRRRRAPA